MGHFGSWNNVNCSAVGVEQQNYTIAFCSAKTDPTRPASTSSIRVSKKRERKFFAQEELPSTAQWITFQIFHMSVIARTNPDMPYSARTKPGFKKHGHLLIRYLLSPLVFRRLDDPNFLTDNLFKVPVTKKYRKAVVSLQ